jgi:YaiO family outer membrane protein
MRGVALLCTSIVFLGAAPDDAVSLPQPAVSASPLPASGPAPIAPAPPRNALEFGTGSDHLTGSYAPWSDSYVLATQRGGAGRPSFYEQFDEGNRYGLHDRSYGGGAYLSVSPRTLVGVQLATSPTHNVAPSFSGSGSVEQRFASGYGATVGLTRRTYPTTNASIESVGADRYVGRYRFSYTASLAQLAGTPGTALTQTLGASYYDDRGGDLTVRAYVGRDVESTGSTVLVMRVSGASLGGHVPLAPATFLVYGVETFSQGGRYSGTGVRFGVSRRF